MNDFIDLQGVSGAAYRFRLWPEGAAHLPMAGSYACVKQEAEGFSVLWVGECNDLSQLRSELPKPVQRAVTHVFTRLNVSRALRLTEHTDLAGRFKTTPARERAAASG
jgi:hypothetical protein